MPRETTSRDTPLASIRRRLLRLVSALVVVLAVVAVGYALLTPAK